MVKRQLPDPVLLRKLFDYDPGTGTLTWKARASSLFKGSRCPEWTAKQWNSRNAGRPALAYIDAKGYCVGTIFGICAKAHRVIWAMQTGAWPTEEIDHCNGVGHDNRWGNLREVSHGINMRNKKRHSGNTSGCNGVGYRNGKWRARITINKKTVNLGYFSTIEEAKTARIAAEAGLGFTERHGSSACADTHG